MPLVAVVPTVVVGAVVTVTVVAVVVVSVVVVSFAVEAGAVDEVSVAVDVAVVVVVSPAAVRASGPALKPTNAASTSTSPVRETILAGPGRRVSMSRNTRGLMWVCSS